MKKTILVILILTLLAAVGHAQDSTPVLEITFDTTNKIASAFTIQNVNWSLVQKNQDSTTRTCRFYPNRPAIKVKYEAVNQIGVGIAKSTEVEFIRFDEHYIYNISREFPEFIKKDGHATTIFITQILKNGDKTKDSFIYAKNIFDVINRSCN